MSLQSISNSSICSLTSVALPCLVAGTQQCNSIFDNIALGSLLVRHFLALAPTMSFCHVFENVSLFGASLISCQSEVTHQFFNYLCSCHTQVGSGCMAQYRLERVSCFTGIVSCPGVQGHADRAQGI